jgi:hypothetical protein
MRRRSWTAAGWNISAAAAIMMAGTALAASPWATIGTPQGMINTGFGNLNNSYFSQTGINFGFAIPGAFPNGGSGIAGLTPQGAFAPNIMFQQGGGQANIPLGLGPATPGASLGYAVKTPLGTMFFGLTASQGSNSGNMGQSGSVTVMNGGTGFVSDTSQSPFVTGIVPVVGDAGSSVLAERLQRLANGEGATNQATLPPDPTPDTAPAADKPPIGKPLPGVGAATSREANAFDRRLAAAQDNSAGQPVASLAEIRAQQAAEDQAANDEYRQKMQTAEAALADGKPGVARIYYQQVVRHASGALKQQAIDALKTLARKAASPEEGSGNTGTAR